MQPEHGRGGQVIEKARKTVGSVSRQIASRAWNAPPPGFPDRAAETPVYALTVVKNGFKLQGPLHHATLGRSALVIPRYQ